MNRFFATSEVAR